MALDQRILLVDDDREIAMLVRDLLNENHFDIEVAHDATSARQKNLRRSYDLMIIDVMMPGGSGLDLCREIRVGSKTPIIMLTAMSSLVDRIIGLELGADDYITKPFEGRELLARVRALLRRSADAPIGKASRPSMLAFGEWRLDLVRGELRRTNGILVPLAAAELRVLQAFAERPDIIMSRDWLTEAADADPYSPKSRNIDVIVSRLRAKMQPHDPDGPAIETVRGGGYVLRTRAASGAG